MEVMVEECYSFVYPLTFIVSDGSSFVINSEVVERVVVEISKINPPINADVEAVTVLLEGRRG